MPISTRISAAIRHQWAGLAALFLVVTGGTAFAVDGPLPGVNHVGSEDIINAEVKQPDIAPSAVNGLRIVNQSVRDEDLAPGTVKGSKVEDESLTGADVNEATLFNDNSVTGADVDESTLESVPAGNVLSAKVSSTGALGGGIGVEGASKGGTGNYSVDFDRPVVNTCAATATLANSTSGEATVVVPVEVFDDSVISVRTSTSAGSSADRAFDVIVVC